MRVNRFLISAVSISRFATALMSTSSPLLLTNSEISTSCFYNRATRRHSQSSFSLPFPRQSPTPSTLWTSTRQDQDQSSGTNQRKNSLLKIMMNAMGGDKNADDIKGVQDFDADLADEIETALKMAGVTEKCFDGEDIEDRQELRTVFESISNINDNQDGDEKMNSETPVFKREIIKPKIRVTAPPHTGLAQVVANQYGIDISSVPYSGSKITAADVEYYNFKLTQPPSTPEALQLAYKLGIDLNVVSMYVVPEYGNKMKSNEPYILKVNDVEQYLDNLRSIRMIERRVANATGPSKSIKKKKLDKLEERMEKNIGRLTQKAKKVMDTVAGGIVEQIVSSQVIDRKTEERKTPTDSITLSISSEAKEVGKGQDSTEQSHNDGTEAESATRSSSNNGKSLFFLDMKQ
mmetsp:Transcript_23918/g.48939  ORF Transcript_23918/g.48939 Transcript_23918/m.48939 type:complete len:406 (+) Transcript_23918:165-1382(+)